MKNLACGFFCWLRRLFWPGTVVKALKSALNTVTILFLSVVSSLLFASSTENVPGDIETLFNSFFREYIALSPETGTRLGIPEAWGITVRNDELDDVSDAAQDRLYQMYRKYNNWLVHYDESRLTPSQKIARDVLKWYLNNRLQEEEFRRHRYIINPMFSFHNQLTTLLTEHHRIETPRDAEDYIKRLSKYDVKVSQLLEQLAIQERIGIIPPLYVAETFQQELDDFVAVSCEENILFVSFKDRVRNLNMLDAASKEALYQKALNAMKKIVYPAYVRMSGYIEKIKDKATQDAGVWKLPHGDEYYKYCLYHHTTTDMTPEEIHTLGLQEVSRIQNEMKGHFASLGISGSEEFRDLLAKYMQVTANRNDKRYFYPATERGKKQTLKDYQAIIDSMSVKLADMFNVIPKASVRVVRVPAFKEKTMATYYEPPKLDGSSSGIFYANLSYQHQKSGMKTLAYHEAIPGHHFQFALEHESSDTRLFKSLFFFTGYVEGWALYAEKLAKEYGFYDDVHSKIENLRSELFRAARLVVDAGIHYKKWTREKAYQYMLDNVGWGSSGEIHRYIVWPGQACAYKIGELKILELRERARKELGNKFDIKDFHSVVLKHGSVPLEILEQLVDEYITTTK